MVAVAVTDAMPPELPLAYPTLRPCPGNCTTLTSASAIDDALLLPLLSLAQFFTSARTATAGLAGAAGADALAPEAEVAVLPGPAEDMVCAAVLGCVPPGYCENQSPIDRTKLPALLCTHERQRYAVMVAGADVWCEPYVAPRLTVGMPRFGFTT